MNFLWKLFYPRKNFEKFMKSIEEGNLSNVKYYYNREYLEKKDRTGLRPIHLACENDYFDIIKFLLKENCNTESLDDNGSPPFHSLFKKGRVTTVKYLLENKYNCENCDAVGMRPIHWACMNGHKDVIKLLIAYGCQLESRTLTGETPLDILNQYDRYELTDLLKVSIDIMPLINEIHKNNIQKLKKTLEQSNENCVKYCNICIDRTLDCVLNCGHTFCMDCGKKFIECPICRNKPTYPKRLYID